MQDVSAQFEQRKKDHIRIALDSQSQSHTSSGLENIRLIHEALPELNFSEVDMTQNLFDQKLASPVFISSMTAGHAEGKRLNFILAEAAARNGWAMGVGSQRKELFDPQAANEWKEIRKKSPQAILFGNLGLAQLIETELEDVERLIDNLQATALFIHTNPLQEALQKEGTTNFKGGLIALEKLCTRLKVPVVLKEVGCGFSQATLLRLKSVGLYAVDIAGLGGTHWGRIEGARSEKGSLLNQASQVFAEWGISTTESMLMAKDLQLPYRIWASGGVRSGLDVAKLVALGAEMVGVAKPILDAAISGEEKLDSIMKQFEFELKVVLFCTGCKSLKELQSKKVWAWK